MKQATIAAALSVAAVFAAVGGEQLMNLPPPPKGGRFTTPTDLVWPAKPGEADVCLWSGDRFAACSITIDDNCKPDHEWWLRLSEELGIKLTWFVITDHCVKDDIFDYPLTVKVRLPDGWKSAKATQGGKPVAVRFVSHDGAPYALVEAVPDKGAVRVVCK